MNKKLKILIADDHPLMREGLKIVLQELPLTKTLFEARDGGEAIKILLSENIDIVTLDVEMPVIGGFGVARKIAESNIKTRIIFLTMHKDYHMFNEAMETGAMGYIIKENAVDEILECVECVVAGEYYISPSLSKFLVKRERELDTVTSGSLTDSLTKMEKIILLLVADNKTTREIADELFISYKTVENHRANIARKLNLHGSHSLLKFAISNKGILK
jgi:DNA-binding NarL/FixJ family response regulator